MELQKAIEILEHHQKWRLGKIDDMKWNPRELTDALDLVLEQAKNCLIADVGGSLHLSECCNSEMRLMSYCCNCGEWDGGSIVAYRSAMNMGRTLDMGKQ